MYSEAEYKKLVSKYGNCASWAIWDFLKESNTSVISNNYVQLHSKFVLLAMNPSDILVPEPWVNFRGGKHDRKLKYACNDTKLRGSYITDLFKDIAEANSNNIKGHLNNETIETNVRLFNQEMTDIKISKDTKFIVLGVPNSFLAQCFNLHFKQQYKNETIYYCHYSYYKLTDKAWVTGFWKKLGIDQDFESTIKKYSKAL